LKVNKKVRVSVKRAADFTISVSSQETGLLPDASTCVYGKNKANIEKLGNKRLVKYD